MSTGTALVTLATVSLMAAGALAGPKGLPCKYEVTILEPPQLCGGGTYSAPAAGKAVNDLGQAAGEQFACIPLSSKPFFWSPRGGYQQLPPVPGAIIPIAITDLNNLGWITGEAETATQGQRGFVHVPMAGYIFFDPLPGHHITGAAAVNDSFQIVGYSKNVQVGPSHGVMWSPDGVVDVGAIIGGPNSEVTDIAADGAMTGWLANSKIFDARAFILTDLSRDGLTVLDAVPGGFTSKGLGINDRHDVVGQGSIPDPNGITASVSRAFAWIDQTMHLIDPLPGFRHSAARAVNGTRVVIGRTWDFGSHGFVWRDNVLRDLNDLIDPGPLEIVIESAHSINEDGVIAASADSKSGLDRAVLLYPIYASAADLNDDCTVNSTDLAILLKSWGPVRGADPVDADLDGNGVVNGFDLAMLLGDWTA